MDTTIESKVGVKNFSFLIEEQNKILAQMEAEYAKGDAADTKKLERLARQVNVFFHSQDASTELMAQRDRGEALDVTNKNLVDKQKNEVAQWLTSGSGSLGVTTVVIVTAIIIKSLNAGISIDSIGKSLDLVTKLAPMATGGLDAIANGAKAMDQAAQQIESHNLESLKTKRNEGQTYRQNASGQTSESLRKLQDITASEAAAWNAVARG